MARTPVVARSQVTEGSVSPSFLAATQIASSSAVSIVRLAWSLLRKSTELSF